MSDINITVNDEIVNIDIVDEPVLVNVVNSPGVPGAPGVGVPVGGTTGQVLAKNSATNYDTEWVDVSGGAWGTITGTLSNQTDLQNALNAKFDDPTGTTAQYLRGDGSLATFPSLTGFVPYTGATGDVNLGTHRITAQHATIASSGSGDTATINHSSGSGIGLNITKGGNGEGLYINKTSGSGNAATIIGTINATTLVKSGGTSSQFLKADGTVDSSVYVPTSRELTINGVTYDLSANRSWNVSGGISGSGASGQVSYWDGTTSQAGSSTFLFTPTSVLDISNSITAASAIARGTRIRPTLTASANNDVLVSLDVSPTFTNGAFTGVSNIATRIQSGSLLFGTSLISTITSAFPIQINLTNNGSNVGSIIRNGATNGYASFRFYNDQNSGSRAMEMGYSGSAYPSPIITGAVTGESAYLITTGNYPLHLGSNNNARLIIFGGGNVSLGSSTDSGQRLQVTGAMKVTGASSYGGNMALNLNQNAATNFIIANTTNGTNAESTITCLSNTGALQFGKYSTLKTTNKIILGNDAYLYNYVGGDISILNDVATGNIKFAAGGSSTAHMTIKSNGRINMSSLPTSSTGLATGDLWNDAGTIKIV